MFAERWNVNEQRPERILMASEARACHEAGDRYTLLVGKGTMIETAVTLELAIGKITVHHLDALLRVQKTLVFAQREGDRLFLESTALYDYAGNDTRGAPAMYATTTEHRKDGNWICTIGHNQGSEIVRGFDRDVSRKWVPIPAFGAYLRILLSPI
jgi:hypothetical protein